MYDITEARRVPPIPRPQSADGTGSQSKEGLMITVEYPPGASDPIHRHNAHGFIYVLEGSIVMQVKGGQEVTLTPGQSFYESPGDVQRLGQWPGSHVFPRMAAECRCIGRSVAFPGGEWMSRHCARPARTWKVEPGVVRQRYERVRRRSGGPDRVP
jgi:Cupin domain